MSYLHICDIIITKYVSLKREVECHKKIKSKNQFFGKVRMEGIVISEVVNKCKFEYFR